MNNPISSRMACEPFMSSPSIQVHAFEPLSQSNGPGKRAVLWVQGCKFGCPGCFNPETHSLNGGKSYSCDQVFDWFRQQENSVEGITISGGEPLLKTQALVYLLNRVRQETSLSCVTFTGFTWDAIQNIPQYLPLFQRMDVLIAGPYRHSQRVCTGLVGSSNKTFHFFTDRYTQNDFSQTPSTEVLLGADGEIRFSGIDPLRW